MLYATWTIFSGLVSLGFHRTCTHTFSKFPFLQTDQFTLFNTPDTSTEYRLYQPKTKKEIKNTTHPSLSLNRHHLSHFLYIPLETPPPTFAKVITPFVLSYDEQCCIFSQHAWWLEWRDADIDWNDIDETTMMLLSDESVFTALCSVQFSPSLIDLH